MSSNSLHAPRREISVDTPKRDHLLQQGIYNTSKDDILGRGSYGTVIKAIYKEKQVAVKILNKLEKSKIQTIKNESNILGWKHENVIEILKVTIGPRYGIVIMERFPGQCLQYILDTVKISLQHRIHILQDITNGLSFCHERNLLHCDIKPQNVLIAFGEENCTADKGYNCKLCDFGSSFFLADMDKQDHNLISGTVRYMSPEALKGSNITLVSDIYSVGITMWQLRTGRYPYAPIESNDIVIYQVIKDHLRPDNKSLQKQENQFLNPVRHKDCICKQFSSESSRHSVEEIENYLTSGKAIKSLSPFGIHKNRLPLLNLDQNICSENLHPTKYSKNPTGPIRRKDKNAQKGNCLQKPSIRIEITNHNQNYAKEDSSPLLYDSRAQEVRFFANLPHKQKLNTETVKKYEIKYKNLYKLCWDQNLTVRPSSAELKKIFYKFFE